MFVCAGWPQCKLSDRLLCGCAATQVDRQFDAVLSGPWYLDQQKPGGCSTYSLQGMWECFYGVEPLKGLDETQSQYVLGGQACQWSEGINQVTRPFRQLEILN